MVGTTMLLIFLLAVFENSASVPDSNNVGIIDEHDISIKEVPYIASLRLDGTVHYCGCTIIHEQFILTAARCIEPNRTYKVLVGTDKVTSNNGGRLYDVEKILINEKYNNETFDYDICLIKLNETLTFGPNVNKITLSDKSLKLRSGMMMNVTGWGYLKPTSRVSQKLRQVSTPMVSYFDCQFSYDQSYKITSRMLCVGKYACAGDNGGPLTYKGVQVGITSFGVGCGVFPVVYTKVAAFVPWIKETIQQNL